MGKDSFGIYFNEYDPSVASVASPLWMLTVSLAK